MRDASWDASFPAVAYLEIKELEKHFVKKGGSVFNPRTETVKAVDGVSIAVHALAGAGRSEIVGRHGEALKVKVAVPPENGRANEAIAAMLAAELGIATGKVTLQSGATSRAKRFLIAGVDLDTVSEQLRRAVDTGGRKGPKRPR